MANNDTRADAIQSFFVHVKDANTGIVKRLAFPSDVQIGLEGRPAELHLMGRFSISGNNYDVTVGNRGIINASNDDTVVAISLVSTPGTNRITVYLPPSPREGQLHFIKDSTGTAGTVPIDVYPKSGDLIDGQASKTVNTAYGSLALIWFNDQWLLLVAGVGSTSSGGGSGASTSASYVTINNEPGLTAERHLAGSTNILMTDAGPKGNVSFDLSTILGGTAGTYTYATVTADSYGRVTALATGTPPPPLAASYITVVNESGLTNERALVGGSGINIVDGGANTGVTASINNNIVATISGSTFTGAVLFNGGLSGSLQQTVAGLAYLVGGANVTITTQSNGQVIISSTATGSIGSGTIDADWIDGGNKLRTTSSVSIDSSLRFVDSIGTDVYFFVSGTTGLQQGNSARKASVFGGDIYASGSLISVKGFSGSLTTLADGVNAYIVGQGSITVTTNSSGQIIISGSASGSSGGSTVILTGTYASRPAAAAANRIFLPSDGYAAYLDNVTSWAPYGPLYPLTQPPASSSFTAVNIGTSIFLDQSGSLLLYTPGDLTTNNRHLYVVTASATPYALTVGMQLSLWPAGNPQIGGLVFRESSTGKFVEFIVYFTANTLRMATNKFTNPTTSVAAYDDGRVDPAISTAGVLWLRVKDDGTNLRWFWSVDGQNFQEWLSARSRTDFLASGPNQVGIIAQSQSATATNAVKMNVISFSISNKV